MNVLLLTSHAIAEYDDLRMLTDLGYNVFSIGGAYDEVPFEGKRPALDVPRYPDLVQACHDQRAHLEASWGAPEWRIDWAKAQIAPAVLDWADTIIVHHFPESWIAGQWDRIKWKRVIWRTCGQSSPDGSLERLMSNLKGLEIIRYSPKERLIPDFAGEDALIRFGKYPSDYGPWVGDIEAVGNITQNMKQRGDSCGYGQWARVTEGLPTRPAGPGSEELPGGIGQLDYYEMLDYLARIRTYLYTGTTPASYTLGLMEAMLSGIPVLTAGWNDGVDPIISRLFEGQEILGGQPHPEAIRTTLKTYLRDHDYARFIGEETRQRAVELFGMDTVGPQWKAYLG